jgi:hypothetical protein
MVKLGQFSENRGPYFRLESNSKHDKVTFEMLQARVISCVNIRIKNGDFTERGLARMLGISQPQIHNVLKGARKLRPELADRLLRQLEMTVLDLFETPELSAQWKQLHTPDIVRKPAGRETETGRSYGENAG